MFSGLMLNAWESASIVAVVAGVVGFFIVLRGSAFAAHALPNGAFAGAAGASLIGVDAIIGLGGFLDPRRTDDCGDSDGAHAMTSRPRS